MQTEVAAEVERRLVPLMQRLQTLEARLNGENSPRTINEALRRIREQTGADGPGSSDGAGGTAPVVLEAGALGAGWTLMTARMRDETLRAAVCAILNAEINCEDGDVVLEINVPEGVCG